MTNQFNCIKSKKVQKYIYMFLNTIIDYFKFNLSLKNRKIHFIAKNIRTKILSMCNRGTGFTQVFRGRHTGAQNGKTQAEMVLKFSPSSCACKTLQEITGNQGSPVNPTHV